MGLLTLQQPLLKGRRMDADGSGSDLDDRQLTLVDEPVHAPRMDLHYPGNVFHGQKRGGDAGEVRRLDIRHKR